MHILNNHFFQPVALLWLSFAGVCVAEESKTVKVPILFVTHLQYRNDHHNTHDFFPAAKHEFNGGSFTGGGALKILDPSARQIQTLLETKTGLIRDPDLDFAAKKIVFSMRRDAQDSYHIFEMNVDGSGLKQLTRMTDVDDLDPIYLPDGHILFTSTREPKYCFCNRHIMANLYRMEPDGANILQISKNTLFDNKPSLMDDGRILYSRWEYVDREQFTAQGLWVCNPDGTRHQLVWGNNIGCPGAVLDGHVIPGNPHRIVCTFSSCHDKGWGAIALIDRALGLDSPQAVTKIWPAEARSLIAENGDADGFKRKCEPKYEHPYPLSDPATGNFGRYFLCVRTIGKEAKTAIVLLDTEGPDAVLYEEPGPLGCFDPIPLEPRKKPPVIPTARTYSLDGEGTFYIQNVYNGTHMQGIAPGDVKYLRVVETPEKRYYTLRHTWSAPAINWVEFNAKRVLGTVPVEEDGSAYFTVPSEKFVYFQLLDKDGMMLQSMRSGTYVQPGEMQGCVGCHDNRLVTLETHPETSLAMRKAPASLAGLYKDTANFNYLSIIQPILNRHCITCHDYGKEGAKKVVLAGDISVPFNVSYMELNQRLGRPYIGSIGAGPIAIRQAKSWGSHASQLIRILRQGHKDVHLSNDELNTLITWTDLNAPYYPSFADSYPDNVTGRCPLNDTELEQLQKMAGNPNLIEMLHKWVSKKPEPFLNFTRPELSPILKQIPEGWKGAALEILRTGAARLTEKPRADMPGFKLSGLDAWREEKYQERRQQERVRRSAIAEGKKVYD